MHWLSTIYYFVGRGTKMFADSVANLSTCPKQKRKPPTLRWMTITPSSGKSMLGWILHVISVSTDENGSSTSHAQRTWLTAAHQTEDYWQVNAGHVQLPITDFIEIWRLDCMKESNDDDDIVIVYNCAHAANTRCNRHRRSLRRSLQSLLRSVAVRDNRTVHSVWPACNRCSD